jgi:ATP-dependent exoDNAse (exonuclease V) alpha subunit
MMPNIVKGSGVTGAIRYSMGQGNDAITGARLTLEAGDRSRAEILGGQNFGFEIDSEDRLDMARRMMEWNGKAENQASRGRKCEKDCLHVSLSWGDGQTPSRAEMLDAGQSFLKSLGMENAQAVFIAHNDTDHAHIHIVASRIDPATGKTYSQKNDFIEGQKWAAQWERDHGQERAASAGKNLHGLIDAIGKRDTDAVLAHLTRDKATFSVWQLNRALSYGNLADDEGLKFRAEILAQPNVIGLRETAEAPIMRYTTREILASEMALQRNAAALAEDKRHGVDPARIDKAAADFTLKPEQADALRHLTGAEGFAVLWGEAGTGKSHTLKAVRAVYEAEGKNVIGLSWQNNVVNQMRRDGFTQANTIAGEMNALEKGRTSWNRDTVLVIDEAGQISTEQLARVTAAAKQAGAKLILAGDDKQLASIEAGGMFETLRQSHGAAILKEVQRNKAHAAAYNQMHDYKFLDALKTFEKAGGIHWTTRQSDTLKQMAERYTADVAAAPDKSRFMFAITNAACATLNQHARALHQARGDLGEDHALKTAAGEQQFATGDRIQFTANGRTQKEKRAGLVNGAVGTVTALKIDQHDRAHVTVELDAARGDKPQRVSFVVGEDAKAGEFNGIKHGYAGTIYRGQGRTLDEVYVGHSAQWRSSAAYVALTRHREAVHIFAARETVKDLEAMAEGMARADNKRAATAYRIDAPSAARAELDKAVEAYADRQPAITEMRTRSQAEEALLKAAGRYAAPATKETRELSTAEKALRTAGSPEPTEGITQDRQQQRQTDRQETARHEREGRRTRGRGRSQRLGIDDSPLTEEELKLLEMEQEKGSRDRGGGMSR